MHWMPPDRSPGQSYQVRRDGVSLFNRLGRGIVYDPKFFIILATCRPKGSPTLENQFTKKVNRKDQKGFAILSFAPTLAKFGFYETTRHVM